MSTEFFKWNELKSNLNILQSQKKRIEKMLDDLIAAQSFQDFRTHYFSGLLAGDNNSSLLLRQRRVYRHGTHQSSDEPENDHYDASVDPMPSLINLLFIRQTGAAKEAFDSVWQAKLRLILDEKNIAPYQRVGNILELFKAWRRCLTPQGTPTTIQPLRRGYLACQQELQYILNHFQMEEIRNCKGAIIDKPISMSGIFGDYRQCYVSGLNPKLKLHTDGLESHSNNTAKYLRNKKAYNGFYQNKKTWCENHHWAEVFLFDNKAFRYLSYYPKSGFAESSGRIYQDVNTHMLAINKIMLETHPDDFDRDKLSKILMSALEKLDAYEKPLRSIENDIQSRTNETSLNQETHSASSADDEDDTRLDDFSVEDNETCSLNTVLPTYDFSNFDRIMASRNRIGDPEEEVRDLPAMSDDEKKKLSWDAWGMMKESVYGRPEMLVDYKGRHRKELRRDAFSFDYSIFKSPLFMNSPTAEKIADDIHEFLTVDVPYLPDTLNVAVSMGFNGIELNNMVRATIESVENQTDKTMASDLQRINENVDDLSTFF